MFAADTISRIAGVFLPNPRIFQISKEPAGNINGTYRIHTADGTYMLQEISRTVFGKNMKGLEHNYRQFLKVYDQYGPEQVGFAVPRWLPDKEGRLIHRDEEQKHWRIYRYLPGKPLSELAVSGKTELFANAVAAMHFLLSHITGDVAEVIGHYHDIRRYAEAFFSVGAAGGRDAECEESIATGLPFILDHCVFEKNAVIHGDTKIGNVLYDENTGRLSFIDLDTFCYSSRLIDIGDGVRSIAYRREDEGRDGGGCFDQALCRDFLKAYVSSPLCRLDQAEASRLSDAVMRIPFELGLRYYTDYLTGNRYFPTSDPRRNLVRAKEQFRLYREIRRCCGLAEDCAFGVSQAFVF